MLKRDWDGEFEEILVFNASRDPIVRRFSSWVLENSVDVEFEEEPDYSMLRSYIRDNWGLAGEGADRALEMCEEDIMQESKSQRGET